MKDRNQEATTATAQSNAGNTESGGKTSGLGCGSGVQYRKRTADQPAPPNRDG